MQVEESTNQKQRYYVYVLKLMDGEYYVGITDSLVEDIYMDVCGESQGLEINRPVMLKEVIFVNAPIDIVVEVYRNMINSIYIDNRTEFYLPEEFNEFFCRIVAMASEKDVTKPIVYDEGKLGDILEWVEVPRVAEWEVGEEINRK